jgi:hypothetical protein
MTARKIYSPGCMSETLEAIEDSIRLARRAGNPKRLEAWEKYKAKWIGEFETLVHERTQELLEHAPDVVGMTPHEKQRTAAFVRDALDHQPKATWSDLLWFLAIAGVRPPKRGAPPKWSGRAGNRLFLEVEGELGIRGQKHTDRKAVRNVIDDIKKHRACWDPWDAQTLRDAYYQVRRRLQAAGEIAE